MNGKAYMGPQGEPVTPATYRGQDGGVSRADGRDISMGGIQQVKDEASHERVRQASRGGYVPTGSDGVPGYFPGRGIMPVPAMGPYDAVAAVGALPPMGMNAPINARTSVRFNRPQDMQIGWYGPTGLTNQLPLGPLQLRSRRHLSPEAFQRRQGRQRPLPDARSCSGHAQDRNVPRHSSVPISFTDEDFEQVNAGNFLVKVIYLPTRSIRTWRRSPVRLKSSARGSNLG